MGAVLRAKVGAMAAAFAAAMIGAGGAWAGSASTNLPVTAGVTANCTITTGAVAFGAYDPVVANATSANPKLGNGTVTIACTKNSSPVSVSLGTGGNPGGTLTTRQMTDGGVSLLAYELYLPPDNAPGTACGALSTVWNTNNPTNVLAVTAPPSKSARTYNICGQVPGGQDVSVGSYTDTVVATVNF